MNHVTSIESLQLQNAWLTIGVFDGVHRGHRQIIDQVVAGAHAHNAPAAVLTFDPHPAIVLAGRDIPYLTMPTERAQILGALGVDVIITLPFTRATADTSAEDFMATLQRHLGLKKLLVGHDFALGRNRAGNVDRLTEIGRALGYDLQPVAAVALESGIVSSTLIRNQLRAGDLHSANQNLGRRYALSGRVIHGDARGRTIGIPTANLEPPAQKLIPLNGVYACWAIVGGEKYQAVANIGVRPTFDDPNPHPHVEAHLLGFSADVYDAEMRLEFVERLRGEVKFPGIEALVAQIKTDIVKAEEILK
jgi:riboflavin kinase/FMN adenylyltransferase